MTLERAIHERWAANAALTALVPAGQVTTGRSSRAEVPYVTILREQTQTALRTNAGDTIDEITLRMNVWHHDYDAAREVLQAIRAAFDRSSFTLADGSRVLAMRRLTESALQHPDGAWQLTIRFLARVSPPGI